MPELSDHFASRKPSAIRQAQILYHQRADKDEVSVVNLAIGNVSLPMHPAMVDRMKRLGDEASPFAGGVVKYTETVGISEAQRAFLHIIESGGFSIDGLGAVVTDGGSAAMELMVLGVCGPAAERPLMLLDPAYTNYMDMARRCAVRTVSVRRRLGEDGRFPPPDLDELDAAMAEHRPAALVVIPADNPTGQFVTPAAMDALGRLAVKHDAWLVSDEAYRQLHYGGGPASSVWGVDIDGIQGRRISIESASKVWNACGLRVGALVTDHPELHARAVAEYTANLCSNHIGQYIFGALASVSSDELKEWYATQRAYYQGLMAEVSGGLRTELPGVIVSNPEAALYSVVDVRNIAPPSFQAAEFIAWCAQKGRVDIDGSDHTLLVAPLGGFYGATIPDDPARFQMRLAYVEPPAAMARVPRLFARLFRAFLAG